MENRGLTCRGTNLIFERFTLHQTFLHITKTQTFYSILAALVAQLAERVLGKDEVGGSNPLEGSI